MQRRRARQPRQAEQSLSWIRAEREPLEEGAWAVVLQTDRGNIPTRYHPVSGAKTGVVWVGGAGGGLDGPARGLYPEGCRRLQAAGTAGLRLHYRRPNHLEECVLDTLVGVEFLLAEGVERVGLVGHSFGGAVVISAGALSDHVWAVVPMSTQTYGTGLASQVSPRAMLLIHGTADEVLPDSCSRAVFQAAGEPRELRLFPGTRHGLDEAREEVLDLLVRWLPERLGGVGGQ